MAKEKNMILANEHVGKLLVKLSVPAMTGMIVMALFNVVDAIYIGHSVGRMGLAGLTIAFPVQMAVMAFSFIFGMGGASVISRSLGANRHDKAINTLYTIHISIVVFAAIIVILGSIFLEKLLLLFGATETILPFAMDYMRIIFMGTLFFTFMQVNNNVIRSEGNAHWAMISMLLAAILNIILDPIFIFGFKLGIKGAAIATVISQIITVCYHFYYYLSGRSVFTLRFKEYKWDLSIFKEVVIIGFPSFVRQISGSILVAMINQTLKFYSGDLAIAVYGVINRAMSFMFMPMFGIGQGLQPIVGFNYGRKRTDLIQKVMKDATIAASTISTIGMLTAFIFPALIMKMFTTDAEIIKLGSHAFRIIVTCFFFVGFQISSSSFFQAIGKAKPSFVLSISRQVLFMIPLILT
ncbi:MAG: MATE family efflux transporter, partial [Candidatus Cloacimonetes bacterium]|nr:MATE family efflux transporter [Candidatus Cloacimonadota bacterium]